MTGPAPVVSKEAVALARPRVAAIDVLRGFVMVLMSIDHASEVFNSGRLFGDSVYWYTPHSPLPAGQFFTRWITHLCAPTFVALAGTALAISTESRRARGETEGAITRQIVLRGLLIIAFEVAWMSWVMLGQLGSVLFQVLFAIGASLVCMAFLRRLPDRALLALGVALPVLSELAQSAIGHSGAPREIPGVVLLGTGFFFQGRFIVGYALVPWLGIMCLGWALGRRLLTWRAAGENETRKASRFLLVFGAAALVLFVVLRGMNGFGNMGLLRESGSLVQWLHVSKYPPSLTYDALELGIAALLLAGAMRLEPLPRILGPLQLFGQTALFFYLLHLHLLSLAGTVSGQHGKLGLAGAYVGALAVLLVLYPACRWYRSYKAAHPAGWARWI